MTIKQLHWFPPNQSSPQWATGVSGLEYVVREQSDGRCHARSEGDCHSHSLGTYLNMDDAKAACQGHFEDDVRSYLCE